MRTIRCRFRASKMWEKKHGRISDGSIVLLRTGWASRWPDAASIEIKMRRGKCIFRDFRRGAAKLLIARKVSGIGCDTMSVDYGASEDFAVHHIALGAGLYHLENLSDLSDCRRQGHFGGGADQIGRRFGRTG